MAASKGAIAISVKPAAVKMRVTRPRPPNEHGPGASGSARAAADVQHALARRGRGGFDRGLAEHRHHGVEPGLVSDPALPALAIPVGDLIGILLCHDISLF